MVTRLKTSVGGTVGPQGGGVFSIPASNAVNRSQSVPVEPPYGGIPMPFILYNWDQFGASESEFPNYGTQGVTYDIPRSIDDTYWALECASGEAETSGFGTCRDGPIMDSLDDIGGSFCSGGPFSAIVSTAPGGEMFGPLWDCTNGLDSGWAFRLFFDYVASGTCFVELYVQQGYGTPSTSQPAALFEWTGASSEDITMIVSVDIAGNTEPTLFIAGGGSPTPSNDSVYGAADCSLFDVDTTKYLTTYQLFGSGGVKGIGFFRGAGSQAVADYWHAYDWATEPGFS